MALFRHPSLDRGIVHTPHGAFTVKRRLVEVAEEIGESLGWERVDLLPASDSTGRDQLASANRMDRLDAH